MKVLYVLGRGRSGSTILANVLGECDGYFAAGEVRALFDPILTRNPVCARGEDLQSCPVWSNVIEELGGRDLGEAARLQNEVVRERNLLKLLRWQPGSWRAADRYAALMASVYRSLGGAADARVIVDSSKRPSYAAFLMNASGVDAYFIHLVRDPRASAYSWRHRRYTSSRGEGEEVTRRNAFDSTLRWNALNLGAETVVRKAGPTRALTLRYEDFVAAPRDAVAAVARLVGDVPQSLPFLDERTVELGPNHTVAGNPSRYRTGALTVADTRDWVAEQSRWDRLVATAVAAPLLRRYRYRLTP